MCCPSAWLAPALPRSFDIIEAAAKILPGLLPGAKRSSGKEGSAITARIISDPTSKSEKSKWAAAPQLRLAGIALDTDRPEETLRLCRALLQDKLAPQREVLLLMGRAYEKSGEPRKAALCFKGEIPEQLACF
jgi:hypothetical protein